jgi:hypothetical protein
VYAHSCCLVFNFISCDACATVHQKFNLFQRVGLLQMVCVADPYRLHQQLKQLLGSCDAAGLSHYLRPPDNIHILSQAVHLGAPPETLMQLLDGSLGLAATPAQLAAANAAGAAAVAPGGASCKVAAVAGSANSAAKTQNVAKDVAKKGKAAVGGASATAAADSSSSANAKDTKKAAEVLATVGIGLPYLPLVGESASSWLHQVLGCLHDTVQRQHSKYESVCKGNCGTTFCDRHVPSQRLFNSSCSVCQHALTHS